MISRIKLWLAAALSIAATFLSLIIYGRHESKRADRAERDNERLTTENKSNIEHIERTQEALAENTQRQAEIEKDIADGKRDHFEEGW